MQDIDGAGPPRDLEALHHAIDGAARARNDDVVFPVDIDGVDGVELGVRSVHLHEALNDLASCELELLCAGPAPDTRELLGKDLKVTIAR